MNLSALDTAQLVPIRSLRRWLRENRLHWQRGLLILGLLSLNAALPHVNALRRFSSIILYLPFILAGALVLLRRLPVGLIAVIPAGLIPYTGPSSLNVTMILVASLLGLWLLDMVVRRRKVEVYAHRTTRPLLYLIITAVLSFGIGQLPWYGPVPHAPIGAQLAGLSIFVFSAGAFLLVANVVRHQGWLEWMSGAVLLLGTLIVIVWSLAALGLYSLIRLIPGSIAGSMLWTWLVALAFGQAVANRRLAPAWRLTLAALALSALYVQVFLNSGWKSGYIPPLVAVFAIISLRSWRLGLVLSLASLAFVPNLFSQLVATDQYSYSTRLEAWAIVAEIVKVNPVLGLGPANYRWLTPLFPIRGWYVQFNSHNQYVDLVAQTGVVGLVCYLWFFAEVGALGWRLKDRVPEGFPLAYVYGAMGGLAGTLIAGMLGDWVLPFFYNITLAGFRASVLPWLFLGGLVAIDCLYQRSAKEGDHRMRTAGGIQHIGSMHGNNSISRGDSYVA